MAGLQTGDRILRANDQSISDWMAVVELVRAHPGQEIQFEIERDGLSKIITVNTDSKETDNGNIGRIGAGPAPAGPRG